MAFALEGKWESDRFFYFLGEWWSDGAFVFEEGGLVGGFLCN